MTPQLLEVELVIRSLIANADGWTVWRDDREKREPHTPSLLTIHTATRRLVAVYARPRKLRPSELPALDRLPDGVDAAVWWPAIHDDVRRWLRHPDGPPPGHLDRVVPGRGSSRGASVRARVRPVGR